MLLVTEALIDEPLYYFRLLSMTSKSKFRVALLATSVALSLFSFNANAGSAAGKVTGVTATRAALWAFSVGTNIGRPACATTNDFAIDNSTAAGKVMIASILAAQAAGLVVNVSGTGNCDVWGDRESAASVTFSFPT